MIPRATYRIQFHKDFPFAAAEPLAPYLRELGISHLYASPIATARAGSNHGYDVVDPTHINPELGGEDAFRRLAATLKAHGVGIILDIVPNHMAVGGADNAWWLSVLEQGEASPYARHFDIDWASGEPGLRGKLLAPFLGTALDEALRAGEVALIRDGAGLAVIAHGTHRFPLRAEDRAELEAMPEGERTAQFDGTRPEGHRRLRELLDRQHYQLAWWRTAADRINWRRFFDITELAGLRVEDRAVFDAVHALPLRLYAEGLIDGVRVDHVDGLADPAGYCRHLRAALDAAAPSRPADASPGPAWLIVEKILGAGEALPVSWRTDGTSGYDFMDQVSALQHDPVGEAPLSAHWNRLSGRAADFHAEEDLARGEILAWTFPGQLDAVAAAFHRLAEAEGSEVTHGMLRRAIATLLTHFRVYRTYAQAEHAEPAHLLAARDVARNAAAPGEAFVLDLLCEWLTGARSAEPAPRVDAIRRFEQLSAPLSAKAVEDTAFYRYARLLSRTDVGFAPATFGLSPAAFAERIAERAAAHPHAMLSTATHDHKRGEDVRARLAVLSEVPDAWIAASERWMRDPAGSALAAGDRYAIVQTIVGAWPLELRSDDRAGLATFADRVTDWNRKAMREAKLRSSWTEPDEAYERAGEAFIGALLSPGSETARDLAAFVDRIAAAGAINGIVQAVLRSTLPGVPDLYQGCELWDFSLVDPDNRRPVDYSKRRAIPELAPELDWRSGRLKQAAIAHVLRLRAGYPRLFEGAALTPLAVTGPRADHVLAFAREAEGMRLIVAVPLRCASAIAATGELRMAEAWWQGTSLSLAGSPPLALAPFFAAVPLLVRVEAM